MSEDELLGNLILLFVAGHETTTNLLGNGLLTLLQHPQARAQLRADPKLMPGAANRDPAVFAEPDRFDITRSPNPHLAFGAGIHYCVGAPLARMEAEVAFEHLLQQFPALTLAQPVEPPVWRKLIDLRRLETLPLRNAA